VDDLSIWAQLSIVGAAALLGPVVTFLLALLIAVVLRSMSARNAPPALVLVVAGFIGRLLRRKLWRPIEAAPQSAGEPARTEIVASNRVRLTRPATTLP
jgi:hypothetical protein